MTMNRNRPYTGQSHTDTGERGKTLVEGLTFRDLRDCYIRGTMLAAGHVLPEKYEEALKGEEANLDGRDLFGWDGDKVDPLAVFQNMSCEIEKLMGIYPNIPDRTAEEIIEEVPVVNLEDLPQALEE